jgi:hypothetical protein
MAVQGSVLQIVEYLDDIRVYHTRFERVVESCIGLLHVHPRLASGAQSATPAAAAVSFICP